MSAQNALISELEDALAHGNADRRAKTLRRITDLFVFGSGHFSEDHVALFDNVFGRLIGEIETSARAALAKRLADVANAPPLVMHTLAFDDMIDVAGPVLTQSARLDNATLIENASTKSQQHLLAISKRKSVDAVVTDVLVRRGDRDVAQSAAENPGAQFSDAGYTMLVARSSGDDRLTQTVGSRQEIPRHHFVKLLTKASQAVRLKLEAADPQNAGRIRAAVAEVASAIQASGVATSRDYAAALALVGPMWIAGRLGESDIVAFARAGKIEETTVALAKMCDLPVEIVERAMGQDRAETILIVARAIGLSWNATKSILMLRAGKGGVSAHGLEQSMVAFTRLKRETAQQVVQFQRTRQKVGSPPAR